MTHKTRIYLDFDGVLNLLAPTEELFNDATNTVCVADAVIPGPHARWLSDVTRDPAFEIIWATHREDDIHHYTDQLGLPRLPHLTFTDPTGSKVKDILAHYQANPCKYAEVWEDSLTSLEILDLTDAGVNVRIYQNTELQEAHIAVRRTP